VFGVSHSPDGDVAIRDDTKKLSALGHRKHPNPMRAHLSSGLLDGCFRRDR
jgi:hypothetical protein